MQQGFAKNLLLKGMCLSPARDLKGVIPACTAICNLLDGSFLYGF